ncbi:MAG: TRAP transporter large permease [Planctomycetes bacterium]|nr:TRAP transporter large permease [Planctomycetota bacterium]
MVEVLFIALAVLLAAGVPISVAMVLTAALAIVTCSHYSLDLVAQKLFAQSDSWPLMAIPLFVLAGGIMSKGGMSARLIRLASALVGEVRGGLAMVAVLACMFFASISGSTAATTAAIGSVMIPAVARTGFSRGAATGLQCTAGSIGIIIPPSIPFILMGVVGGMSIGELFLGGVVPGILAGLALMATAHVIARVQRHPPSGARVSLRAVAAAFWHSILSLLTVVLIVGAIMGGWATATEAAILAVVWAFIVSFFIYKELTLSDMPGLLVDTAKVTGIVVLCIGATAPFGWLLTAEQVPARIAAGMLGLTANAAVLKLLMVFILLAVGTFLDLTPALILLVPIFQPIAQQIQMDPIQFGVMMVLALAIGQSTPPVGISLFVACSIARIRIGDVALPLVPFLAAMVVALLITTFWSPAAVWLPATFMRQ